MGNTRGDADPQSFLRNAKETTAKPERKEILDRLTQARERIALYDDLACKKNPLKKGKEQYYKRMRGQTAAFVHTLERELEKADPQSGDFIRAYVLDQLRQIDPARAQAIDRLDALGKPAPLLLICDQIVDKWLKDNWMGIRALAEEHVDGTWEIYEEGLLDNAVSALKNQAEKRQWTIHYDDAHKRAEILCPENPKDEKTRMELWSAYHAKENAEKKK